MSQYYRLPATSVEATNPSVGTNNSSAPTSSTQIAGVDTSGDLQQVAVTDAGEIKVSAASLPLPSGAATAAKQDTGNASLASIDTKTPALVTGRVPVDGSGVTQPISAAALPLPAGAATAAKQPALGTAGSASADVISVQGIASMTPLLVNGSGSTQPVSGTVTANAGTGTFAVSAASLPLPSGAATETTLAAASAKLPATLGQKASTASMAVVIASDQSTVPVSLSGNQAVNLAQIAGTTTSVGQGVSGSGVQRVVEAVTSTSAVTSVAASASSVSILASNANRSGACFYNDSTAVCYLKLGATASTTSYTVQLAAGSYYELPTIRCYTGAIDAIWASATGNLRITELS